jgi:hypothetical protein
MGWTYGNALLGVANLLIPVAVLVFATGFFPYKPFVPGLAVYHSLQYGDAPRPQFDKIVFMVVDALRSDFVYAHGSGFQFTQRSVIHPLQLILHLPRNLGTTTSPIPVTIVWADRIRSYRDCLDCNCSGQIALTITQSHTVW